MTQAIKFTVIVDERRIPNWTEWVHVLLSVDDVDKVVLIILDFL